MKPDLMKCVNHIMCTMYFQIITPFDFVCLYFIMLFSSTQHISCDDVAIGNKVYISVSVLLKKMPIFLEIHPNHQCVHNVYRALY